MPDPKREGWRSWVLSPAAEQNRGLGYLGGEWNVDQNARSSDWTSACYRVVKSCKAELLTGLERVACKLLVLLGDFRSFPLMDACASAGILTTPDAIIVPDILYKSFVVARFTIDFDLLHVTAIANLNVTNVRS